MNLIPIQSALAYTVDLKICIFNILRNKVNFSIIEIVVFVITNLKAQLIEN